MNDRKHGRGAADAHSERDQDHGCKARIPDEPAYAAAEIACELVDERQASHLSVRFAQLRDPANAQPRLATSSFFREATPLEVFFSSQATRSLLIVHPPKSR